MVLIGGSILCLLTADLSLAVQKAHVVKPEMTAAQSAPEAVKTPKGFPIEFESTDIFNVFSSSNAELTPANRAKLIQQNIQIFADSHNKTDDLKIISLNDSFEIAHEDNVLMVVTKQDADQSGKSADELSKEILDNIQTTITNYRTKHTWQTYGLGAAFSILSIIGLWQALHWNNHAYIWLRRKVSNKRGYWKKGIQFKEIEVLSAKKIDVFVLSILKFLRILVVLLCLYFFLPLILSFFPETRELGSKIFDYLLTPFGSIFHTVINYIPNLFYIFVIIVIANYVLKVISYVFGLIERGELEFEWFYDDWARPTYQIIRFLIIVTALISAYPYIPGSSSNAFQGVGLVLGAIISFASSSAISNIVAGIILTYTRAFRLNDRIKVGDTTGDVVEKTLLVTRLKTIKHVVVTIPNSLVMGSQIINYSTSAADGEGVILPTSVTIGYDVPWQTVESLLIEAALATKNVQQQPSPYVLKTALNDFYVNYEINVYTKAPEQMAITFSNLHQHILEKFDAAGVEIMSPHYYAVRDGNASTVPSVLNVSSYSPPAFNVNNPK